MSILLLLTGVLLPLAALGVQLLTGICSTPLVDPLGNALHMALILSVPVANLELWWALSWSHPRRLGFLTGLALTVSAFYSLLFAPYTTMAIQFIPFFGLGLLALAPLLSLLTGLLLTALVRPTGKLKGMVTALLLLLAASPDTGTHLAVELSRCDSGVLRGLALGWLHDHTDPDHLQDITSRRPRLSTDVLGLLAQPLPEDEGRKLVYLVFGTLPKSSESLQLSHSSLEATLSGPALAHARWELVFEGWGEVQAEVKLPPGGVVSGAALWIDGQPREADFVSAVRAQLAYESVVRSHKDPLLVSSCGRDRVSLRAFPVVGSMRLRLDLTWPLEVKAPGEALYRPPQFVERNFSLPPQYRIQTSVPLGAVGPRGERLARLEAKPVQARVPGGWVTARLAPARPWGSTVVVLDGSAAMAGKVRSLPVGPLLLARDPPRLLKGAEQAVFWGGQDNLSALEQALDRKPDTILWVHGPQSVTLSSGKGLDARLARSGSPRLLSYQIGEGSHHLLEDLTQAREVPPPFSPAALG